MLTDLWGSLAVLALVMALVFATLASVHVNRVQRRVPPPISDEIGSAKAVVRKVRKREPMSEDEWDYAKQLIGARGSLLTFCIPGALFSLGCFYVFGSLHQLHGARPSERTFLGVFPMLASTNLTIQTLRSVRLKTRLKKIVVK